MRPGRHGGLAKENPQTARKPAGRRAPSGFCALSGFWVGGTTPPATIGLQIGLHIGNRTDSVRPPAVKAVGPTTSADAHEPQRQQAKAHHDRSDHA